MIRDVDIREISDGKLYRSSDMVRADTGGCAGCSRCCREMPDTVILDPMDVFRLMRHTGSSFDGLLGTAVSLDVSDGLVLPHLGTRKDGACTFLNDAGRCSIHDERPGFCRLFPLGRYYQGDAFLYFLQVHECTQCKTKVKIKRWLEIDDLPRYEAFVRSWHRIVRRASALADSADESFSKQISLYLLEQFYRRGWDTAAAFYPQYDERAEAAEEAFR